MFQEMFRVAFTGSALFALAACASGGSSFSPGPSGGSQQFGGPSVISAPPMVSGPAGCSGPISEYLAIINKDSESGMLSPSVFNRISGEMDPVRATCSAGREKEALGQLAALKKRHGYR